MWEDKRFLRGAIVLLIGLNAIFFINQIEMQKNLKNEISNLVGQIQGINMQVNNQTANINNVLESFKEDNQWVSSKSFGWRIVGYDKTSGLLRTHISWTFKELAPNSQVFLSYGEAPFNPHSQVEHQNVEKWSKVRAKAEDALSYSAEVMLSPEKFYRLMVQSEGGGTVKGQDIQDINMGDLIQNRFMLLPGMDAKKGPRYESHIYLVNRSSKSDSLKIKSAKAEVYVNNELESIVELHKASENELSDGRLMDFQAKEGSEVWLNDEAVWVKGEENWVKTGEGTWVNKGKIQKHGPLRIDFTIIDELGITYKKTYQGGI